ncbi:MAG: hypothetical protein EXS37_16410 [Opitutus sp.]|nr:hypothetical protein [Opitutus sp.]
MASPTQTALVQGLFVQNMMAVRGCVVALMPAFSRVDDVVREAFLSVTATADDIVGGTVNVENVALARAGIFLRGCVERRWANQPA